MSLPGGAGGGERAQWPQWQCGGLEKGPHDAYALTVPSSAVSLGFAYFLEAFDINGNGPARAGSPHAPLAPTLEEAPATLAALAGVAGAEPLAAAGTGFFASRSSASLTALGIGAAAALGAIATLGLGFSKVAGDEIGAANVHSTTRVQAASARTLSQVGLGLTATAAVGLGAGLSSSPRRRAPAAASASREPSDETGNHDQPAVLAARARGGDRELGLRVPPPRARSSPARRRRIASPGSPAETRSAWRSASSVRASSAATASAP